MDSAVFAETQDEPSEAKMVEHFDMYKKFFAGEISDQNPYGFGYKLPDRAKLEYVIVKFEDVSKIVAAPTQQEKEEYYQRYSQQLTKQVPLDPNDPNSPLIERTRSYPGSKDPYRNRLRRGAHRHSQCRAVPPGRNGR